MLYRIRVSYLRPMSWTDSVWVRGRREVKASARIQLIHLFSQ